MEATTKKRQGWRDTLSVYLQMPILWVFLLGIASGFPLLLTASTLAARLTESGVDIKTIGLFALIGLPYTLKFLVAPIVDALHITRKKSHLAHRKSWCLLTQCALAASLCGMALCDPATQTMAIAVCALLTASFSAMQDIVIDALRIEILSPDAQGAGAAASVAGYRTGMLLAGAGALILAVYLPWNVVYFIAAGVMACTTIVTMSITRLYQKPNTDDNSIDDITIDNSINIKNNSTNDDLVNNFVNNNTSSNNKNNPTPPANDNLIYNFVNNDADNLTKKDITPPPNVNNAHANEEIATDEHTTKFSNQSLLQKFITQFKQAVIAPLKDFCSRPAPLTTLLFIATFKLSDAMAGTLSVPFYLMLGFSKVDIAAVTKVVGVIAVLIGTFIGGLLVTRRPMFQCLVIAGILQIVSNFVFVWLAHIGAHTSALTACILIENITGGMGTAAFVAFMAQLCNIRFTATQYALLSSLSSVGRTFISSSAGFLVDQFGWAQFYIISAALGLPGMFFLWRMYRTTPEQSSIQ